MLITTAIRLVAPAVFFGYAALANLSLLRGDVDGPELRGFLKGEFAQELDGLYRSELPHREVAVGWIGMARYALLNEGRDGVVAGDDGWLFSSEEFRSQNPEEIKLAETLAYISEVQDQLATLGTDLLVIPLPAKIEIEADHSPSADQIAAMAASYDLFVQELVARGIKQVDTRPALALADEAFFQTDTHWTDLGAIAVAKAVAQSEHIEIGTETFNRVDKEPIGFTGDLVSFVTSDSLGPFVGLQPEFVVPYVAEAIASEADSGALDLFGGDGPLPVSLVGTSYSANENWSFVEALKLSTQQDVLNYAKEGLGPVAPMHDYLETLDPSEAPPLVLWEFPVRYLSDPSLMDAVDAQEEADNA